MLLQPSSKTPLGLLGNGVSFLFLKRCTEKIVLDSAPQQAWEGAEVQ